MKSLTFLRIAGLVEGLSLLLLVFVAMPLKYFYGFPLAVRVVGSTHGLFFLVYVSALFQVMLVCHWSIKKTLQAFLASLIPFGFLWVDQKVREEFDAKIFKGD